jgi:hypothetical protein
MIVEERKERLKTIDVSSAGNPSYIANVETTFDLRKTNSSMSADDRLTLVVRGKEGVPPWTVGKQLVVTVTEADEEAYPHRGER